MKKRIFWIGIIVIVLGIVIVGVFCTNYSILHLSPTMCGITLDGISPEEFCNTQGDDTWLQNRYLFASVDQDGCLILVLDNNTISKWKSTFFDLQVLQCILGEDRDIGITVDYSEDFFHYKEYAHTCGYDISSDYTKVVESPDDNSWYYPVVMTACMNIQMFEGKSCSEIAVEYSEIDDNGQTKEQIRYLDDIGDIIINDQ